MNGQLITVVEVPPFPDRADTVWSESERNEFIGYIASHPLAGDEIPGTGGLRKVRWNRRGMGKRGGVRVIYYFYNESVPLFLLTVYPKAKRENLTPDEKKKLSDFVKELKLKLKERR